MKHINLYEAVWTTCILRHVTGIFPFDRFPLSVRFFLPAMWPFIFGICKKKLIMSQESRQNCPKLFRRLRMNEITISGERLQNVRAHDRGERGRSVRKQSQRTPARGRLLTAAREAVCFWEKGGKLVHLCVCECEWARVRARACISVIVLIWPWRHLILLVFAWSFLSHAALHRRSLLLSFPLANAHAHTHTHTVTCAHTHPGASAADCKQGSEWAKMRRS